MKADALKRDIWILVAGTGLRSGVPLAACLAATAVGSAIAHHDCCLVTGGWPGVDFMAAEAFAAIESAKGSRLEDRLVQVVPEDREAEFPGGRVVKTKIGPLEWLEPQSYCDAVVLIGGLGGTFGAFLSSLHKGIPRFPLGGTEGDAKRAFEHMCHLWDAIPNPGIAKHQFEELNQSIATHADAASVADHLLPLVIDSVNHRQGRAPKSIFISYSKADVTWLREVSSVLQPLQQSGLVHVWSDVDMEPGVQWDAMLRQNMARCDYAILLVSKPFLESEYVRTVELPVLLERARAGRTRLLWLCVSPSDWRSTALRDTQAAFVPTVSLTEMSPADVQVALVGLRARIERYVRDESAG